MTRHSDLSSPRQVRRVGLHYDQEAFGQFSESIARTLGTARFLVWQTGIVILWIALNVAFAFLRWDKYPFILLNLAFSTQAAYAAPLILLAQNRQENRDRVTLEQDRRRAEETKADTEYLARELAALRLAMGDVAKTRESLRRELEDLRDLLRDRPSGARPGSDDGLDQHAASPH